MEKNEMVPELTNGEFEKFIKEGFVLLDFFAEWCMPCTMMEPILNDLSEKFDGKIKFGKINVDDNTKIAQKFEISSIPTFVFLKDCNILERISGAMSQEELEKILETHL